MVTKWLIITVSEKFLLVFSPRPALLISAKNDFNESQILIEVTMHKF